MSGVMLESLSSIHGLMAFNDTFDFVAHNASQEVTLRHSCVYSVHSRSFGDTKQQIHR